MSRIVIFFILRIDVSVIAFLSRRTGWAVPQNHKKFIDWKKGTISDSKKFVYFLFENNIFVIQSMKKHLVYENFSILGRSLSLSTWLVALRCWWRCWSFFHFFLEQTHFNILCYLLIKSVFKVKKKKHSFLSSDENFLAERKIFFPIVECFVLFSSRWANFILIKWPMEKMSRGK